MKTLLKLDAPCGESALASTSGTSATKHAAETRIGNRPQEPGSSLDTAEKEEEHDPGEWAAEEENEEHEEDEQMPATEAGVPEGINERVSADSDESFLS